MLESLPKIYKRTLAVLSVIVPVGLIAAWAQSNNDHANFDADVLRAMTDRANMVSSELRRGAWPARCMEAFVPIGESTMAIAQFGFDNGNLLYNSRVGVGTDGTVTHDSDGNPDFEQPIGMGDMYRGEPHVLPETGIEFDSGYFDGVDNVAIRPVFDQGGTRIGTSCEPDEKGEE